MRHAALLYKVLWYFFGYDTVGEKECKGAGKFVANKYSLANREQGECVLCLNVIDMMERVQQCLQDS